jgi:hypothetical protein
MNIFNSVKQTRVKKSLFDLTHDVKLSCNMGELVPILNMPCLPGDKVQLSGETLVRFAPMLAPMMHRVDITIHYFFCPYRILWPNWEKFITGVALDPNAATTVPAYPVIDIISESADPDTVRLADYLGVPPTAGQATELAFPISAMPFVAYNRIWFEYYRDQNQQQPGEKPFELGDGLNVLGTLGHLHNRAWEHDYFTAALPWAQKGGNVRVPTETGATGGTLLSIAGSGGGSFPVAGALAVDTDHQISTGITPLEVNMGTINDLRKAYKLQEWLEKNARGGTRYKESLLAHFGVNTSDKRLQRPEYITGLKTPVVVSEVLNTTGTIDLPQGNMAGHGVAVTSGNAGTYFCEEHGIILGIMSILPKTAYQQGLPKDFIKFDYLDFGWPEFAHLGEQPIDLNEIYAYVQPAQPGEAWGYIPRYSEYKFMLNRVAGDFRTTLNYWHMGRIFATAPGLDETFIVSDPTKRIFAVTDPDVQSMYVEVLNHIKALRPLPKYGNPGW